MTYQYLFGLPPVKVALELGWSLDPKSKKARTYFQFIGPVEFEVAWRQAATVTRPGHPPVYTVGNTSTTYSPRAIELLERAVKGKVA
jgi:hypothetical protein